MCIRKYMVLATMAYYRRRILKGFGNALMLGVLPILAAAFLAWVIYKAIAGAGAPQNWSLIGVLVVGVTLMLVARLRLKSPFFAIPREADAGSGT